MGRIHFGQYTSRESPDFLKLGEGFLNEVRWRTPGWYTPNAGETEPKLSNLRQNWWNCWAC